MATMLALTRGPALRRVPWSRLLTAAGIGALIVWWQAAREPSEASLIVPLRITAVLLAASAAAALDDVAEALTSTTPFGRPRRRAVAMALTAMAMFVSWLVVLVGGLAITDSAAPPFAGQLAIELAAVAAVGWLLAAVLARGVGQGDRTRPSIALVVTAALSLGSPHVVAWLWASPDPGATGDLARHWALVGGGALLAVLWLSRDPASRLARRR